MPNTTSYCKFTPLVLSLLIAACGPAPEAVSADATGAITGQAVFEGRAPAMRPLPIEADPGCKALHGDTPLLSEMLVLGEGQGMANVLVYVVGGLPAGKSYPVPTEPVEVTQKDCRYGPHVIGLRAGQAVRFTNPDGLQHNVHPLPKTNREVNRAMSKTEREFTHTFPEPEPVFRIKCDVHAWMEAWCGVFDHPYFAVTDASGNFTIEGLPAGDYELEAWHEVLGTQRAKVTVTAGTPVTANWTFKRPERKP